MTHAGQRRTPHEVFADHTRRLGNGDLETVAQNYSADAVMITPQGVALGHDGVRSALARLLSDVPDAEWSLSTQFAGDVLLLNWSARSRRALVRDGVDTFVFGDGLIRAQTVTYAVESVTEFAPA